jgi:hypothetical protein
MWLHDHVIQWIGLSWEAIKHVNTSVFLLFVVFLYQRVYDVGKWCVQQYVFCPKTPRIPYKLLGASTWLV